MQNEQQLVTEIREMIAAIKKQVATLEDKVGLAEEAGIEFDWEHGALSTEVIFEQLTLTRARVEVEL